MKAELHPVFETHKSPKTGKPVRTVEHVIVYVDGYPYAMVHSDFVHDGAEEPKIYQDLSKGHVVEVDIKITLC